LSSGGVVGVAATGVLSVLLPPVVVQAASTAEAAANEKLRRARRGDDGFNGFSSNGQGRRDRCKRRSLCRDQADSQTGRTAGGDSIALWFYPDPQRAHIINQSAGRTPAR
jgi:hypothetical protein